MEPIYLYCVSPEFSHQHICKEEEDPTNQQVCSRQRNSRLTHEDLEPPQIKEEQQELCIKHKEMLLKEEGEKIGLKQGTDAAVLNPFCNEDDQGEDIIKCIVGSVLSEPNNELHLLHVADHQISAKSVNVHDPDQELISCNRDTNTAIFKCNTCGKDFNYLSKLQRHLRVHVGKTYICTMCGKTFKKSCGLSQHLRIHTGEKPFVCATCGKAFIQKGTLSCHMRIHTGEKPYVCATCGTAFKISIDLTRHMRVHTGEKPYVCTTCGKDFRLNATLSSHMRIHTGEKPYVCKKCGKAFSKRSNLSVHIKVHTGKKTHICHLCGKAFSSKWNLSHHIKVHTEQRL